MDSHTSKPYAVDACLLVYFYSHGPMKRTGAFMIVCIVTDAAAGVKTFAAWTGTFLHA